MSSTRSAPHAAASSTADAAVPLSSYLPWATLATLLTTALVWSYWATIAGLWKDWQNDPNYSVGQLVPPLALYAIWTRRHTLRKLSFRPSWPALGLLLIAQLARYLGLIWFYESAERYALVLTVVATAWLLIGWPAFWQLRWVWVFLFLMVPLPGRIHNAISGPLQQCATVCTVFTLDVFAVNISREGNILVLSDASRVGIAEACSGLRMLTAFIVVAAVIAFQINRPRWQRATLVLSSIPIAIICNTLRLVITTILYAHASSQTAERFFHDFAGITMMPIAIVLLLGELWLLNTLIIPDQPTAKQTSPN